MDTAGTCIFHHEFNSFPSRVQFPWFFPLWIRGFRPLDDTGFKLVLSHNTLHMGHKELEGMLHWLPFHWNQHCIDSRTCGPAVTPQALRRLTQQCRQPSTVTVTFTPPDQQTRATPNGNIGTHQRATAVLRRPNPSTHPLQLCCIRKTSLCSWKLWGGRVSPSVNCPARPEPVCVNVIFLV
jgi:hypothetical protein